MSTLIFIAGLIWGSLSAQFFVQTIVCLVVASLHLLGFVFSSVSKANNALGAGVALFQTILFGALFVGGNWIASNYIDYEEWNATSIGGLITFLATIAYIARQVPGKIMLANMCAWEPYFFEASSAMPVNERIAFAKKW